MVRAVAAPLSPLTYHGLQWVGGMLPTEYEPWPKFSTREIADMSGDHYDISRDEMQAYLDGQPWVWPERIVYFICDVHADTDAFFRSLVASGGFAKIGPADSDFDLTPDGSEALLIIGGDCLDKGPSNLRLLRAVRDVIDRGVQVEMLAGNHDIRFLVGLQYAGRKEPQYAHLFARMGKKSAPFFKEIYEEYLAGSGQTPPAAADVRAALFPDPSWYEIFPEVVRGVIRDEKIDKEVRRIREKTVELEEEARALGLTLGHVAMALDTAKSLFTGSGEFAWFFDRMDLAYRAGSFLFIHGGVDDVVAAWLHQEDVTGLNQRYWAMIPDDLFELYNGPVGNAFRTKYRPSDFPFTEHGVRELQAAGIYAIVHGHKSIDRGQRIVPRDGMLNIECDACVNRNTRRFHGLPEQGGAATIFRPDGTLLGISTDYPYAKRLVGSTLVRFMTIA